MTLFRGFGRGAASRIAGALGLLLAALAAGCSSDKPEAACPRGVIPADAANITHFRDGPGRDLTDVVAAGHIQNFLIQCKYSKKDVDIDLQIAITADRGPADRTRAADFDYWVAVVDPDRKVLQRTPFRVHFEFADNVTHLGTIEQIEPIIPLKDVMKGPNYQIWMGFQLTEDQLKWNRSQNAQEQQ